ncbi:MAG: hypothetical protein HKN29_14255 [Rhodothermales bacterium]|nr:hypothetical protein [Rhodothermales bacterium]
MAARPTFSEVHEAYARVASSLREAESARARVYLVCQFLNTVAHSPRLADLYAEQLLAGLPSPVSAREFEGISPERLLTAADLLEAAGMGLEEDSIGSRRLARLREVSEALATAAMGGTGSSDGLVVPLAEANPDVSVEWAMRPCRLTTRSLTLSRTSGGDRFQLSGVMLDGETRFQTRVHKPVLVARRLLGVAGSVRFAAAIELEAPAPLASGDLANLGLTLLTVDAMSSALMTPRRHCLQPGVAAAGDVQADGRVTPFAADLLSHIVTCVFHSSAGTLVVPHAMREDAEAQVRSQKEQWPDRDLSILGVHRVADALSDNRIFHSKRRSRRVRVWRFLERYIFWFTAVLVAAVGLVSLAAFGYGPVSVLRALAPTPKVTAAPEGATSVAGSTSALLDLDDGGFVAAGWHGESAFIRRYSDADSFTIWPAGQDLEARLGSFRIIRLVRADGGLFLVGSTAGGDDSEGFVGRITPDGRIDSEFGEAGVVMLGASEPEAFCEADDGLVVVGSRNNSIAAWRLSEDGSSVAEFIGPPGSGGRACLVLGNSILIGGWAPGERSRAALVLRLDGQLQPWSGEASFLRDWSDTAADEVIGLAFESGDIQLVGTSTWYGSVELVVDPIDNDATGLLRLPLGRVTGRPQILQSAAGSRVVAFSSLNFLSPEREPVRSEHEVVIMPISGPATSLHGARLLENVEADDLVSAVAALSNGSLVVGGTRVTPDGARPFVEVIPSR